MQINTAERCGRANQILPSWRKSSNKILSMRHQQSVGGAAAAEPGGGRTSVGQWHSSQQSPKQPLSLLSERLQAALSGPGDYIFRTYLVNEFMSDSFKH